ncbi:MAG TPA: DUF6122 family protein [Desulfobacterales bacterium]
MIRPIVHILLHLIVPGVVARAFFPARWKFAWMIMVLTLVVDLDHLMADPIYDPNRCSLGYHPLHSLPAIVIYGLAAALPVLRIAAVGLLLHMGLDGVDCIWMGTERVSAVVGSAP